MNDLLNNAAETALSSSPEFANAGEGTNAPRKLRKRIDYHMWGTYILLVMIAIVELFSASIQEVGEDGIFGPIIRHGRFILVGLACMFVLQAMHYRLIFKLIVYYAGASVLAMGWVLCQDSEINGALRAISFCGITVLPAECMKLGVALAVAWCMTRFQIPGKRDISTKGFIICLIFLGICAGLLFSQGLSNTIIVLSIGFSMMFVAGLSWKKMGILALLAIVFGGAGFLYKTNAKEDVEVTAAQQRINELNHVEADTVSGSGRGKVWNNRLSAHFRPDKWKEGFTLDHQQEQLSYIAQANGGILGVGIGKSRENARLPLAYSDYVYAIVVEELGLIGGLFVLLIYMWILGRSAKLTLCFRHTMPGMMVMGCAFVIVFQALYHMAIVSGFFPVSGQPLPLISKGGMSVLVTSWAFGIMLSCARHAVRITDSKIDQRKERDILPEKAQGVNVGAIESLK